MRPPAPRSPWLLYTVALVVALTVILTSLGLVARASIGFIQPGQREKSSLDLQIESAREIRAALARPIVVPPLPPITAHRLHDVRSAAAEPTEPAKAREQAAIASTGPGMDAMAMGTWRDQASSRSVPYNQALDRHRPQ